MKGRLGPLWVALEPPDLVHLHLEGVVRLEEAEVINEENRRLVRGLNHFFYLIDMGGDASLKADVRRSVAIAIRDLPLRGTAIYNATPMTRMFARLLLGYVNIGRRDNPVTFHRDEVAARQWIDNRRKEITSKLST